MHPRLAAKCNPLYILYYIASYLAHATFAVVDNRVGHIIYFL